MGLFNIAQRKLAALHNQRVAKVIQYCSDSDLLADTGSARAESVPGIPEPVGNQDFGGFIVVTSSRMIYQDVRTTIVITFNKVKALSTYSFPLPMTCGLNVDFWDGERLKFSGNTAFILKLVKEFNSGNIPLPLADFSEKWQVPKGDFFSDDFVSNFLSEMDKYIGALDTDEDTDIPLKSPQLPKKRQTNKGSQRSTRGARTSASPKYRNLTAQAWVSVKEAWLDDELICEDPAWLVAWSNKEIDLLPKDEFRSFQECLDNSVDSDFFNIVPARSKRTSLPSDPKFILVGLAGNCEFQATLSSTSDTNKALAKAFRAEIRQKK